MPADLVTVIVLLPELPWLTVILPLLESEKSKADANVAVTTGVAELQLLLPLHALTIAPSVLRLAVLE